MTTPQADRDIWRGVKVAVFLTVVGPLTGGLIVLLLAFARTLLVEPAAFAQVFDISAIASIAGFVGLFAYILGGLPALVAGVMLGWLTAHRRHIGFGQMLVLAGIATGIAALIMELSIFNRDLQTSVLPLLILLLPLALVSAIVCRWLMIKFRLLPRI